MAKVTYDMSAEAALIEVESAGGGVKSPEYFARDCEFQAGVDDRLALWFAANGNAYQAERARARAARWRAHAAGWRQGRAAS